MIRMAPWNTYWEKVGAPNMLRPLNPKTMIMRADESPEHVELAVAQRRRSEKHRGEGGQQIGVRRARGAAAEARGEKRAGERRAHAGNGEAEDLDAVNADAGEARRRLVAADRLDFLADRRAFDKHPKRHDDERHEDDRIGNAEEPTTESQLQEGFRHAGDDRHAGRIGEREAYEDGADAERRDDGIHSELGDDQAIGDANQSPQSDDDRHRDCDRQLAVHDQSGDQHAVQARRIADREVHLADDERERQSAGDDHRQRRLVEDVDEIVEGGKRVGRQDGESDDHQRQPDDRRVAGKNAQGRLGGGRETARGNQIFAHATLCSVTPA